MSRMTGAKFMADTLKAYGVTHVFLVPAILRRALAEMDLIGIKRVITHGEKAAAYMADGYARASGKPGVCMAQSVGAANLAAGLQDAYLGLSPVIALTGHKRADEQYRNAYQEIEHSKPFASVTKFSAVVDNAEQLPHLLRQAFREATTGAPAPVHLDIQGMSGDYATEAEGDFEVMFEANFAQRPAFRPESDPESVRTAARALASAQRPVIVAGGGVTLSGAQQEVVELAEMLNIPVATSLNAKGTIPTTTRWRWEWSAHTPGGAPTAWSARPTWSSTSAATRGARSPTNGGSHLRERRSSSWTSTLPSWAAPTRPRWRCTATPRPPCGA